VAVVVNSAKCTIEYNQFKNNKLDIELTKNYVDQRFSYSSPFVVNNNFWGSDTVISVYGRHPLTGRPYRGDGLAQNLTVPDCYWGTVDSTTITQRIYDKNDNAQSLFHEVKFRPFKTAEITAAGIQ
jgi:hypothetical protein